jgi:hypothetical protein
MGRVFLGVSPQGRRVAIKVVHPHYANDPEFRARFTREVAAARKVGDGASATASGLRGYASHLTPQPRRARVMGMRR